MAKSICKDCSTKNECTYASDSVVWCPLCEPVETNIYDIEEVHTNCTVQILRNSVTGETSVGWFENEVRN